MSDVGGELAHRVDDLGQPLGPDLERVVAEVERAELGAERGGGLLGLGVADLLDVLDRLALLLPQLAGLAALAVGERDHLRGAAVAGGDRDRAAGAPHEVGGVGADHEHAAAHATPAATRVLDGHGADLLVAEAASRNRSAISASPSSTGGLKRCPRSEPQSGLRAPTARVPRRRLPAALAGVRGRERPLQQRAALGQRDAGRRGRCAGGELGWVRRSSARRRSSAASTTVKISSRPRWPAASTSSGERRRRAPRAAPGAARRRVHDRDGAASCPRRAAPLERTHIGTCAPGRVFARAPTLVLRVDVGSDTIRAPSPRSISTASGRGRRRRVDVIPPTARTSGTTRSTTPARSVVEV